jgi:1-deoxy-D-xylulose-5-phosphate reductoisomerase
VLNAANEEAVAAFLQGTIRFTDIHSVNAETLSRLPPALAADPGVDDLIDLDQRARAMARHVMQGLAKGSR